VTMILSQNLLVMLLEYFLQLPVFFNHIYFNISVYCKANLTNNVN
jgi:hypothetical protein